MTTTLLAQKKMLQIAVDDEGQSNEEAFETAFEFAGGNKAGAIFDRESYVGGRYLFWIEVDA